MGKFGDYHTARRGLDNSLRVQEAEIPRIKAFLESQDFAQVERTPDGPCAFTAFRGPDIMCFIEIRVRSTKGAFTFEHRKLKALARLLSFGPVYIVLMSSDSARLVSYQELALQSDVSTFGEPKIGQEEKRHKDVRDALRALQKMTNVSTYRIANDAIMFALKNREEFVQFAEQRRRRYVHADASVM